MKPHSAPDVFHILVGVQLLSHTSAVSCLLFLSGVGWCHTSLVSPVVKLVKSLPNNDSVIKYITRTFAESRFASVGTCEYAISLRTVLQPVKVYNTFIL